MVGLLIMMTNYVCDNAYDFLMVWFVYMGVWDFIYIIQMRLKRGGGGVAGVVLWCKW